MNEIDRKLTNELKIMNMPISIQVAPTLTWRDVQYLTVYTSDPTTLMENTGWRKNGVGLLFNPRC